MFKSGILDIRKVRSESNIKLFEYFGQPMYIGNPFSKLGKERKEILQNELKLFWKEHPCFRALLFPRDISTFSH